MYEILPYSPDLDKRLDHFVECESVNGTFLQTRRFLNYHPADRFTDASFALEKSGTIVAYFPGVAKEQTFVSHAGTTFGGPIIAKSFYSGSRLLEIMKEADQYLAERFKNIRFKITPAIFAEESPDLLEYTLEHMGYTRHTELSSYSALLKDADPLENCDKECRRIFKKSEIADIRFGNVEKAEDFETFYRFLEISKSKDVIIQDRTLMEGVNIFVANNYAQGNLTERDYNTYMDTYNVMMEVVKEPDLMIYLRSGIEHLVYQIQKRGRDYEQSISIEYLSGLNERYENWIAGYKGKLIIVDADNLDFLSRPEDFASITDRIDAELFGLF